MKKNKYNLSLKDLFLILTFALASLSFTIIFQKGDAKIYWSKDKPLTWADFTGKILKGNPHDAYTDSGIDFKYSYSSKEQMLVIDLLTNFVKNKSSVKSDKKVDYLLNHEQRHFDISEIFTRKFRKNITEEKFKEKNFTKKLEGLSDRYLGELRKYQDLYDKETEHSKNKKQQTDWDERILKELEELEKYSESHFSLVVK